MKKQSRSWSDYVTKHSRALSLEKGIFTWRNPHRIALSLKRSAGRSLCRKGTPFQSAMSMLNFYINRAGRKLNTQQRSILEKAKKELQGVFRK